jgi:hypothetical protein
MDDGMNAIMDWAIYAMAWAIARPSTISEVGVILQDLQDSQIGTQFPNQFKYIKDFQKRFNHDNNQIRNAVNCLSSCGFTIVFCESCRRFTIGTGPNWPGENNENCKITRTHGLPMDMLTAIRDKNEKY